MGSHSPTSKPPKDGKAVPSWPGQAPAICAIPEALPDIEGLLFEKAFFAAAGGTQGSENLLDTRPELGFLSGKRAPYRGLLLVVGPFPFLLRVSFLPALST